MSEIKLISKIHFDVENKTKKHVNQSSWKKVAMVNFSGDADTYYAWFINKRYNLVLNPPIRGAHISFINESFNDIVKNNKISLSEAIKLWNEVKAKWDKKSLPISLNVSPNTNGKYWWVNISEDSAIDLQAIRNELGLGPPYFNYHMTIGYANEKNLPHGMYIHNLIKKGFCS